MNLQSIDAVEMVFFFSLVVAVHSIDHPHLRTSTPYTREVSDGVEAEKEE